MHLKLPFKTPSKFTVCPPSTLQTHPPPSLLCGQLSQSLPHSTLCCLCSSTSSMNPPFALHWLKAPTYTSPIYCPKATQSIGLDKDHTVWRVVFPQTPWSKYTNCVLPGKHPATWRRQRIGSLWRWKGLGQSPLDLPRLQSSNYAFPARYLLLPSIKKLLQLPCSHPAYLGSFFLHHRKPQHIKKFFRLPSNQREQIENNKEIIFLLTFTKDQQNPESEGCEEMLTLIHSW